MIARHEASIEHFYHLRVNDRMSLSDVVVPSLLFKSLLDFLPLGLLQQIVATFEEFFKRVRDPRIDRRYSNNVASLLQLDPQMLRASVLVLELDEPAKIS